MTRLSKFICILLFCGFLNFFPLAVLSQNGATARQKKSEPLFKDVSEESGLDFVHFNGMSGKLLLPEIMGAGAAFFDYDNDGDPDVFFVQGNDLESEARENKKLSSRTAPEMPTGRLFRNDLVVKADGSRELKFTDVTRQSGIAANGYGFGVATGDVNNDGFTDLYVFNLGSNKMFINNGDGTFSDETKKTKTDDPRWSVGASFFDYDRDGWLDLMVINYAQIDLKNHPKCYAPTSAADYCGPKAFTAAGNSLFRNRGDGTFENVTAESGIGAEFGHALGAVAADLDDDGWTDIYIANDGDPNQIWINQKNGKFENAGFLSGAAVNGDGKPEASMGVDVGDFNGDGADDIFITHLSEETHTLYKNLGAAMFDDFTAKSRIALPGKRFTGFGTAFLDFDNDSLLDIFIANGAVKLLNTDRSLREKPGFDTRHPLGQPNQLFRNTGNETFEDVSQSAGAAFAMYEISRGAAFGDADNDGDTDILVVNNNGRARLLLNQTENENRWLGLMLVSGKRDALGAKVEVFFDGKKVVRRRSRTDGSYASAHDPRVLIGLGAAGSFEKIRVTWASGKTEEFKNLPIGKYTTLREASAETASPGKSK